MAQVLGFQEYTPGDEAATVILAVREVLDEYRDYLPMTVRQIFYRLVGSRNFPKTEKAYKRLAYIVMRARRARYISFGSIRDDGVTVDRPFHYNSLDDVRDAFMATANHYRRNRQDYQDTRLIAACEAAGMVPQLVNVCDDYGIPVRSSGGFDSVTAKYELASEIFQSARDTTLLHVGDHDPPDECPHCGASDNFDPEAAGFIDDEDVINGR